MNHKRRNWDRYCTPGWASKELMNHSIVAGDIFECCVGNGDLLPAFKDDMNIGDIFTNDVDVAVKADSHRDMSLPESWEEAPSCNWVVTNPPFALAMPILKLAYAHASYGVAFLLRISFLEPTGDRAQFLCENPPVQQIVLPRISFTGDGKTDSVTCAWLVWSKVHKPECPILVVYPEDDSFASSLET